MFSSVKTKSRTIAAAGTALVHVLLFVGLGMQFNNNEDMPFPMPGDDLELKLEDLMAEDISLSAPGQDMMAQQREDPTTEKVSDKTGQPKPSTTASAPNTANAEPEPYVEPKDTIIKKIEVVKAIQVDTIKKMALPDTTVSLAMIMQNVQPSNQKEVMQDREQKQREKYKFYQKNYRNIYNFKKVYPYALKTREIMDETDAKLATMTNESEKRQLIKDTEKRLFKEYEKAVRTMSTSQGKLLLKLIARETNKTGYEIIKGYKGKLSASFWYGVGKIFGTDLKTEFHKEKEDSTIETILSRYNNNELY